MAGEKFNLDISNMIGDVGQEVTIHDDGKAEATKPLLESTDISKSMGKVTDEIKDGDLVEENGKIFRYDSKKAAKQKAEQEENTETETTVVSKEKEKTEEARQEEANSPDSKKADNSPYSPYAVALIEAGVLPHLDITEFSKLPKEQQAEKLVDAFKEGVEKEREEWISGQPEVLHDILNGLKENPRIPLMHLIQLESEKMELENISVKDLEEDEDMQEQLVRINLSETTKFTEEKIEKEITRLKTSGELSTEAKDAHKELMTARAEEKKAVIAKAKADKIADDNARTKFAEEITKTVNEVKEIFPGTKVTADQKKELVSWMTKPVAYAKNGQPISKSMEVRAKNPESFDLKLNHYIQLGYFNDEIDTSKITAKAKTESVKKLAEILEKNSSFVQHTHLNSEEEEVDKTKPTAKSGIENFQFPK